jgi:ketosteroid isomerase-like protein
MPKEPNDDTGLELSPAGAVRAVCAAWESLDASALALLFAPEGVYDDPLKAGRLTGPAAIREGNAAAMAQLKSCRIDIDHLLEAGPTALAEGRFDAETADGGRMEFPFALVAELREGTITRLAEYFDTRHLLA